MKKTDRTTIVERRTLATRDPIVLRPQASASLFLKPSFAISAQRGGLVVNVCALPVTDWASEA